MKTQAIVPSAGIGIRFQSDAPKPLVPIIEKPMIVYALEAMEMSDLIDSIILVVHEDYIQEYEKIIKKSHLKKVTKIISGGLTRSASVTCGLKIVDRDTDFILIHDGARPLVTTKIINEIIEAAQNEDAVIVAVPVKPTIKRVAQGELIVQETLKRDELWEVQTPQIFKKEVLVSAHEKYKEENPTDDAMMVEKMGVRVKICMGDYKNIKVTTKEDLEIAQTFLKPNGNIK